MKAIEKPLVIIYTTLFILLATILLILTMTGCMGERIEGNRDLQTEERTSQPFSDLISNGSFKVVIIPDSETRIVVKAESNILPHLYTTTTGSTMTIGFKNGYNIHEHYPIEVFVYTPVFQGARLSGSGTLECSGFSTDNMDFQVSGSGNITADFNTEKLDAAISGSGNMQLSGIAKNSKLSVSGSGNFNAQNLAQENCSASISGSGDIVTAVSKKLDAAISGSGSVLYIGDPVVTTQISGSGKVLKY